MGLRRHLGNVSNPLIVIQWIVAITTLIGGLYVVSPFLQISIGLHGPSGFLQTLASETGIIIFGVIFILSALVMIAGIVKRKVKWRSLGLFVNGLARLYVIFGTLLAIGPLPLTWLSNAVVMVLVFYIWGRIRRRGVE